MDEQQKEELIRKIEEIFNNAAASQGNTRGGYIDLRRLEGYILQVLEDI
jgi:hypothetical protein